MSSVDYTEQLDNGTSASFADRELDRGSGFHFSISVTPVTNDGTAHQVNNAGSDKAVTFFQNLKYWNKETRLMSVNNLDNTYFQAIVAMGVDAVPYILEELEKGPTQLVHALDLIFPGVVKYEGFVSLKKSM